MGWRADARVRAVEEAPMAIFAEIRAGCRAVAEHATRVRIDKARLRDYARDFPVAARMLELLGVRTVRLMTNNPAKVAALEAAGTTVVERVPHALLESHVRLRRHFHRQSGESFERRLVNRPPERSIGKMAQKFSRIIAPARFVARRS